MRVRPALAWLCVLETVSFVALVGAMVTGSEGGVSAIGLVHGLLFLAYALAVFLGRDPLGWSWGFTAIAIVTGPVGAILALERLRREAARPEPTRATH